MIIFISTVADCSTNIQVGNWSSSRQCRSLHCFQRLPSVCDILAANFGSDWLRILPEIVSKRLCAGIWSGCAASGPGGWALETNPSDLHQKLRLSFGGLEQPSGVIARWPAGAQSKTQIHLCRLINELLNLPRNPWINRVDSDSFQVSWRCRNWDKRISYFNPPSSTRMLKLSLADWPFCVALSPSLDWHARFNIAVAAAQPALSALSIFFSPWNSLVAISC